MFVRITQALTVNTDTIGFVEDASTTDEETGAVTAKTKLTMIGGGSTVVVLSKATVESLLGMTAA